MKYLLESMKEEPNYEKALKLLERLLGRPIFRFQRRQNRTFCPFTYVIFYHKKEEKNDENCSRRADR